MKNPEHFGVTADQLRALVAEGLRGGGDWCDLYFEDTAYHDLLLRDGEVASGGYHVDYGCGIRVLKGEKTGYAYAETTDYPSLLAAAKAAGAIASSSYSRSGQLPPETSSFVGPHRCASLAVPPLNVPRVAVFPEAVAAAAPLFWPQNWRKGGLQERRNEVVREQGFYNQTWCGCEFSRKLNP